jgi:hypothetical protein
MNGKLEHLRAAYKRNEVILFVGATNSSCEATSTS